MEMEPIESDCDWDPPEEIPIIESHVLVVPSGVIPLDDFVKQELEREEREKKLEDEKIEEMEEELGLGAATEEEKNAADETSSTESSIDAKDFYDPFADALAVERISGDDDFELFDFEVTKPQVKDDKSKRTTFGDRLTIRIRTKMDAMKLKAQQEAEEALQLRLVESTENFLDTLIGIVVETSEYVDPDDVLREKLDRDKLVFDVTDKMSTLDVEYRVQSFLNLKMARYFWRKKQFRPLQDKKLDQVDNFLRKYHDSLMAVNHQMTQIESIEASILHEKRELQSMLKDSQMQTESKINEFVDSVKQCFGADSSEDLDTLIDTLTKKMNNVRKEISEIRIILIQRQHTLAELRERSRKLEDLGNGLYMRDYEHLTTETQALAKKIEERHKELNRLRSRYTAEIHLCAHTREKQKMGRNTIISQKEILNELVHEKKSLREVLNHLRKERLSIRMKLKQRSFNMGLGDNPELLLDYDATVDKIHNLRKKLADMKAEQKSVDWKIDEMVRALRT